MIRRIISLFLTGMLVSVLAVNCVIVDIEIDIQDKSRESSVPVYDARM